MFSAALYVSLILFMSRPTVAAQSSPGSICSQCHGWSRVTADWRHSPLSAQFWVRPNTHSSQISDLNPSLPQMIQFGADAERSNSICGEIQDFRTFLMFLYSPFLALWQAGWCARLVLHYQRKTHICSFGLSQTWAQGVSVASHSGQYYQNQNCVLLQFFSQHKMFLFNVNNNILVDCVGNI